MLAIASLNWTQRDIRWCTKKHLAVTLVARRLYRFKSWVFFLQFYDTWVTIISDSAQRKTLKLKRALGRRNRSNNVWYYSIWRGRQHKIGRCILICLLFCLLLHCNRKHLASVVYMYFFLFYPVQCYCFPFSITLLSLQIYMQMWVLFCLTM